MRDAGKLFHDFALALLLFPQIFILFVRQLQSCLGAATCLTSSLISIIAGLVHNTLHEGFLPHLAHTLA